jgi:hypothetical protein
LHRSRARYRPPWTQTPCSNIWMKWRGKWMHG